MLGTVSGMLHGLFYTSQDSQLQTTETISGKTKQKGALPEGCWITEMTRRLQSQGEIRGSWAQPKYSAGTVCLGQTPLHATRPCAAHHCPLQLPDVISVLISLPKSHWTQGPGMGVGGGAWP